jgi:hypothetical protein
MAKNKPESEAPTPNESATAEPKKSGPFQIAPDPVGVEAFEESAHKYDIGDAPDAGTPPSAPAPAFEDLGELPNTYQEDVLYLVARDPHWLFSYWDFDWARVPRGDFRGGVPQFFLKVTSEGGEDALVEIKPEARNWYVPVGKPATTYTAQLGWFDSGGAWHSMVTSRPATTPADELAPEQLAAEFATVPAHIAFDRMLEMVRCRMEDGETLLEAVARIAGEGRIEFAAGKTPTWNDEQKRLLAALLGASLVDRAGLGSAELDQLLRKHLHEKLSSESASELSLRFAESLAPGPHSLFSGIGASWSAQPFSVHRERGFFMHVNAEIIFYGGTHPDATVWVDGKEIKLSPDGTFRYHFKLPDGEFAIPIVAEAPDKLEKRIATLSFTRGTVRVGDVGSTSQPPYLDPLIGKK